MVHGYPSRESNIYVIVQKEKKAENTMDRIHEIRNSFKEIGNKTSTNEKEKKMIFLEQRLDILKTGRRVRKNQ